MTRTRISFVLGVLALAVAASACGRYLEAAAAVVDGEPITMDALDQAVEAALTGQEDVTPEQRLDAQRGALAQLIQDRIIQFEAKARKITVDPKDVEDRYQAIRSQFSSEAEFAQALAQQGVELSTVRDRIRLRLEVEAIQKALVANVKIADVAVRNVYGDGSSFVEVRARQILFAVADASQAQAALAKAQDAIKQLRAGADFAALAKRISDDPRTKARGGDLGVLRPGAEQATQLEEVAFSMRVGQISDPIPSQAGYHVLQVTAKGKRTLAQAAPEIRESLRQQQAQVEFQKFISKRVEDAGVEVNPRFGRFDPEQLSVVERSFFTPAQPARPEGIPGLQLPPGAESAAPAPAPAG